MTFNQSDSKTILVEITASFVFSLSYFVWLGRTASESFSLGFLDLALGIGVFYLAAVFISSWDYRADLFPVYSLLRCLTDRSLKPLIFNVGGQIVGALIGFVVYSLLFRTLLTKSPFANPAFISPITVDSAWLLFTLYGALVAIMVYFTVVTRKIFRMEGFTGTMIIGLIAYVVSAIAVPFKGLAIVTIIPDAILHLNRHGFTTDGIVTFLTLLTITMAINLLVFFKLRDHRVVLFYRTRASEGLNSQKND